ncbi:MAG TPA: hypothetical protein ENJ04_09290 [Nitrospirae bacterium]|nr:hypothetical protein [Nitrospirota bacterium]
MAASSVRKPSVVSYFNAILFPFVYFFSRKRMIAGAVSLLVCLFSIPLMFFFVGVFSYFAMSAWATWNLRYELMSFQASEQARAIAEKMAANSEKNG